MQKIIFLKIGWMKYYQGTEDDYISGGGGTENKHEIYNFLPLNDRMYGFVEPHNVDITRIGAKKDDIKLKDVLVVWVATRPGGGGYIVGWYKNALLFRNRRNFQSSDRENFVGKSVVSYITIADPANCTLVPEIKRDFIVPYGKDGFGQSQLWYADKPENRPFIQKVLKYIEEYE